MARFGIEQPVALVLGNGEMVGDDVELLAGHLEHGARIEVLHGDSPMPRGRAQPLISPERSSATNVMSNSRAKRNACKKSEPPAADRR